MQKLPPLVGGPAKPTCPGEEYLGFSVAQLAAPALVESCTPVEQLTSTTIPLQESSSTVIPEKALPSQVKTASIVLLTFQSCLP